MFEVPPILSETTPYHSEQVFGNCLNFRSFVALHALVLKIPVCSDKRLRDFEGEFCKKYATSSNFSSVKTHLTLVGFLTIKIFQFELFPLIGKLNFRVELVEFSCGRFFSHNSHK